VPRDDATTVRVRAPGVIEPRPKRRRGRSPHFLRPLTPTMQAWESMAPSARAARTRSEDRGVPYLSSPRVEHRWYGFELHCGHCGHLSQTICEVKVDGVTSFLCFFCLESGRDAHHRSGHADAMRLAVERRRKPY
jgi:hypothetical protein